MEQEQGGDGPVGPAPTAAQGIKAAGEAHRNHIVETYF